MSIKPTIIVLILAAASATLAWYIHSRDVTAAEDVAAALRLEALESIPVDDVNRIELTRGTDPALVYERNESGIWRQTAPIEYAVDPFSLRQLPLTASQLRVYPNATDDAPDAEQRALLKLDPPAATLRLQWPDGEQTIHLGRKGVAGRAYIALPDTENALTIHTVSPELHDRAIGMNPWEWRDRQIFTDVSVESQRITRRINDQPLTLARSGRTWTMIDPVQSRTDAAAVEQFIDALARVRLSSFIADAPDDLSPYGLAEPVAELSITTRPPGDASAIPQTQTLLLGSTSGVSAQDRYAMLADRRVVFQLPAAAIIELFSHPANQYIDPTGSSANPADVQTIAIRPTDASNEMRFQRDLERWIEVSGSDPIEVPYARVERLMQYLTAIRGARVDIQAFPREYEVATISFFGRGGAPLDTIRIAHDPDADEWALENGDNVLRVMPAEVGEPPIQRAEYGLD